MRLAHKISNDRLLTFSTRQAVHTGASERVVAQVKERAGRVRPWVVRCFGFEVGGSSSSTERVLHQHLGPWDVQVLFSFWLSTSSRAGEGQPCHNWGQCCAACEWALKAGVWGVWCPPSQE